MSMVELGRSLYCRRLGTEEGSSRRTPPSSPVLEAASADTWPTAFTGMAARPRGGSSHEYRLVAVADKGGCARQLEFRAQNVAAAMLAAERSLRGHVIELFEDGRLLAKLKCSNKGFWVVLPIRHAHF